LKIFLSALVGDLRTYFSTIAPVEKEHYKVTLQNIGN